MTIQDLVDKQSALIAAIDEKIVLLTRALNRQADTIERLATERDSFRHRADQRWRLREELEQLEQLVGFGDGDSGDPDKCEAAVRKIAEWKTELRRRIIADRDNEIKLGKFTAGWAWASSTELLIWDAYAAKLKEFGL